MTEARAQLSDLVSRVAFGGQPVMLTRHGKPLAALVPATALRDEPEEEATGSGEPPVVLDLSASSQESRSGYTVAAHHRNSD